jgi:hypothetical protein
MGAPSVPKPIKPPTQTDPSRAILSGLAYADMEKKLRASTGRKSTFLTQGSNNTLLGQ